MSLVQPHGPERRLMPLLLEGDELNEELKRAGGLKKLRITSRETSDAIMMGIGAFTPLTGFMSRECWKRCCEEMKTADGVFWPIPITLSANDESAAGIAPNDEAALIDEESGEIIASIKISEKYKIDKAFECESVFKTTDEAHPGVAKVMEQGEWNIAGDINVLSESYYPGMFPDVYMRPAESRKAFDNMGWSSVAALQLRNPMHRSHEYLAKIAVEVCDGVFIHQLVGKLKAGDIPAEIRVKAVNKLAELYFAKNTVIQGGYPLEMRYAGPREALLHAVFRQNYGCSHLIVGRDHAGVGSYYGPFDAQKIFEEIPDGSLLTKPLNIDWTFWCYKCHGMASMRTCPHSGEDRLMLSGTKLRDLLAGGGEVPPEFSRPEVLEILREYYATL